jgi:predicted kinase
VAQALGAIRIRSDVERKRLHGLAPGAHSHSAVSSGLYGPGATLATYARLAETARLVIRAGYTAILDAAFLSRSQRAALRDVAAEEGVPIALLDVRTPEALLAARITARAAHSRDASEADLAVLAHQRATAEPVDAEEDIAVIAIDGRKPLGHVTLSAISTALFGSRRRRTDKRAATTGPERRDSESSVSY